MELKKYRSRFSLISSGKGSEEKQIFLVATIESDEVFYYSGYRIHPDNFVKEKVKLKDSTIYVQQVKNNTFNKAGDRASKINSRLKALEGASLRIFQQNYEGRDIEFSKDEFKILLQKDLGEFVGEETLKPTLSFFEEYERYKNNSIVSDGRRRHYVADINRLKEYETTQKVKISFMNLNIENYKNYISDSRSTNTVVTILKRLKAFYNYCHLEL